MTNTTAVPPATGADARNRAVRTFLQGLGAAVLASVTPVVLAASGQIHWTREWWLLEAGAVGFAAVTGALSYVTRYTHPPQP